MVAVDGQCDRNRQVGGPAEKGPQKQVPVVEPFAAKNSEADIGAKKRQEVVVPRSALTGPVTALHRVENRERVERALAQLSEEHRQVLLLRYFEGFSAEETGQRMNRTAGAVRNLAARALVELGKHLET